MSCTVAISNSLAFSPVARVPVTKSPLCKSASFSSSSSPNSSKTLTKFPSFTSSSSSSSSPSLQFQILRFQKPLPVPAPAPINLIRNSKECSTSAPNSTSPTVLKRKRPAKLDIPIVSTTFGNFLANPAAATADFVEVEGDGYYVCCKRGRRGPMEDRYSALVNLQGDSKEVIFSSFYSLLKLILL